MENVEKFLVVYDTKKYHCTVICKAKIIGEDKWGNIEVSYFNGNGITHKDNIFDNLEDAKKYCKNSNRIELI